MLELIGVILLCIVLISIVISACQVLLFTLYILFWARFPETSKRFSEFCWEVEMAWRRTWRR